MMLQAEQTHKMASFSLKMVKVVILSVAKLVIKFIYFEKATKFFEISTLLLSYVVPVKSKVEISQNFVAF